jgi:hypothetical protein
MWPQDGLDLVILLLSLPSTGITGMIHPMWLNFYCVFPLTEVKYISNAEKLGNTHEEK